MCVFVYHYCIFGFCSIRIWISLCDMQRWKLVNLSWRSLTHIVFVLFLIYSEWNMTHKKFNFPNWSILLIWYLYNCVKLYKILYNQKKFKLRHVELFVFFFFCVYFTEFYHFSKNHFWIKAIFFKKNPSTDRIGLKRIDLSENFSIKRLGCEELFGRKKKILSIEKNYVYTWNFVILKLGIFFFSCIISLGSLEIRKLLLQSISNFCHIFQRNSI